MEQESKHKPEEKPSRGDVRLISEINQISDPAAAKLWWKRNEADILTLSEDQQSTVDEQFRSKLKSIEDGTATPGAFKFENVEASRAFCADFETKMNFCLSEEAVDTLIAANKPKLNAITGSFQGKSDKDHMREKIAAKKRTFINLLEAG